MTEKPTRVKLGTVAQVAAGQAAPQGREKFGRDGHPFVRAGNLERLSTGLSERDLEHISRSVAEEHGMRLFREGTVLFAKSGMSATRGLVHELRVPAYVVSHLAAIVPGPKVHPSYLRHWFTSHPPSLLINDVAYPSIRLPDIASLAIPLPLLNEQKRLADILDKAVVIRRKRQESLCLQDEFLRGTFLEMFGNPLTNERGWDQARLRDISVVTTGNTPPRINVGHYGDAIEWIKSDNINTPDHYITRAKEGLSTGGRRLGRSVGPEAILVTCIAGSKACIGNVAIADREVAFNQQINGIQPRPGTDHRFLYVQLLVGKRLVQGASTDSMKGLVSKSKLEAVKVLAPPFRHQKQFGEWFTRWHTVYSKQKQAADEAERLFRSLSQRAFRGELRPGRVVNPS